MVDWKSGFKVPKKEDTQPRLYKHEYKRGFKCKSFQMDDTNRLAHYISQLEILPNLKRINQKGKRRQ